MKLFLTTHAVSTWNELGKSQGHCDTPLSESGQKMAELLAERGDLDGLRCIVTSDLKRARDTAVPLARRLGIEPVEREDIREGNWPHYHQDPNYSPLPCGYGFESGEDVEARARRFLQSLEESPLPSPALIVSHGFFLKALFTKVLGVPEEKYIPKRTALSTIEWDGREWRVSDLMDASHLGELDQLHNHRNAG